jgi:hypothetical protein
MRLPTTVLDQELHMIDLYKICRLAPACMLIAALGTPRQAYAQTVVRGKAFAYPRAGSSAETHKDVPGASAVTVQWRRWTARTMPPGVCNHCEWSLGSAHPTVAASGNVGSYSYAIPAGEALSCHVSNAGKRYPTGRRDAEGEPIMAPCPPSVGNLWVGVGGANLESTFASFRDSDNTPDSTVTLATIQKAPHEVGTKYWARRVGTGRYPIFIIEGFDPADSMTTEGQINYLEHSPLPGGNNVYDYLLAHDYTLWLISAGDRGGDSIAGRNTAPGPGEDPAIVDAKGLAYDAMRLIKRIRTRYHSGEKIVIGGYSMGGLVALAGLRKWCAGAWSGLDPQLVANCPEVALWFAADSPLDGANVPVSLQRYLKDSAIAGELDPESAAAAGAMLGSWAAREMLIQQVGAGCNVNCDDAFGCSSTEGDFDDGCPVIQPTASGGVRKKFKDWIGPTSDLVMTASGVRVPGIALTVGRAKTAPGNTCASPGGNPGTVFEYVKVAINIWGDHHLYSNTAGGLHDCDHGSRLSSLQSIASSEGHGRVEAVNVYSYPTFVPSWSSLLWDTSLPRWKNYWYENIDNLHVPLADNGALLPIGSAGFLVAWIWEYTHGNHTVPVCNNPVRTPIGRSDAVACRSGCGDGTCTQGERVLDSCPDDCNLPAPQPPPIAR